MDELFEDAHEVEHSSNSYRKVDQNEYYIDEACVLRVSLVRLEKYGSYYQSDYADTLVVDFSELIQAVDRKLNDLPEWIEDYKQDILGYFSFGEEPPKTSMEADPENPFNWAETARKVVAIAFANPIDWKRDTVRKNIQLLEDEGETVVHICASYFLYSKKIFISLMTSHLPDAEQEFIDTKKFNFDLTEICKNSIVTYSEDLETDDF
jgi:hypothetical protein